MLLFLKKAYVHLKKFWKLWLASVIAMALYLVGRANKEMLSGILTKKDETFKKELAAIDKQVKEREKLDGRYKAGLEALAKEKETSEKEITRRNKKKLKEAAAKTKTKKAMKEYAKELAKQHGLEYIEE